MKKRLIAAILALTCVFNTACAGTNPDNNDDSNQSEINDAPYVEEPCGEDVKLTVQGVDGRGLLAGGSGITACSTVLGFYGINIKPMDLKAYAKIESASSFIDGFPSPWDQIVGDPKSPKSYYYAAPITKMVNDYIADRKSSSGIKAKDISGATLDELKAYIDKGQPVVVWGTITGNAASETISWELETGEDFVARDPQRVYTMIGYNDKQIILCNDKGKEVRAKIEYFNDMYNSLYSQAILIYK